MMTLANKENPVSSNFYVRLQTPNKLKKDTIKSFYNIVKKYSPNGVLTTYEVTDSTNNPSQAMLVYRKKNNKHIYEIPLTRNLTATESYKIVYHLDRQFKNGDFLFETSTPNTNCCTYEDDDIDDYDYNIYNDIAIKLSRFKHNKWVEKRISNGWVLGPTRSDKDKTHPLIKSWNLLSNSQQDIDYELPKELFDILHNLGYTVINIKELNSLIKH